MKFLQIIKIKPITGIVLLLCVMSCKEPEEYGFLSDNIVSKVDTIFVERGISTTSQAPFYDLSTRPYHFSFGEIRTEDNTVSTQMTEEKEVRLWTDAFIPREDTTEAQVMAKLVDTLVTPVIMNPLTGVMQFTTATKFVDESDIFTIDLNVSNIAGEKELKDYVVVKLSAVGSPFKATTDAYIYYKLLGDEGKSHNAFFVTLDTYEDIDKIMTGTSDFFKVTKNSDEPTIGVKVYFQLIDKNGNPYNGNELLLREWNERWLPNFGDNSIYTVVTDTGIEFNFPMVPWPAASSEGWDPGICYYYTEQLPMSRIDTTALFSDPRNEAAPEDRRPPDFNEYIGFYFSLKTGIRIMAPGTYTIQFILPFTTNQ